MKNILQILVFVSTIMIATQAGAQVAQRWPFWEFNTDGGIQITGSHNPPEYNGIKLVNPDGSAFSPEQQKQIENLISTDSLSAVKLKGSIPKNTKPFQSDGSKMKQILINLVGNAIKFTETGNVEVKLHISRTTGHPTRLDVKDTGIGIPEDRLTTIFEPFSQAESGTSRKYGGTGLGLTISYSLCEMLGYRLTVDSKVNEGSTFHIHFQNGGGYRNG